ncbi:hypothetical protein CEXT_421101 [Caerostris extrusa]|uniref:Uncharacterized protein n=1 Tax=Caerostris extrusa TaxID=172846 RepID=A0AAV4XKH3_CAEEX|nr:hypothetical protein CEXT_421101 [Caerostris extrusa]
MSIHAGVSSMMEMEVSPDDSQSFRADCHQPLLNNISNLNLGAICSTLQSIESEILSYQEEFATYQICARLKSTQQTPGLMDLFQSAMELV